VNTFRNSLCSITVLGAAAFSLPAAEPVATSPEGGADHLMNDITDEQHAILQKTAWETVSSYRYARISK
jgi:hypothetical protein